MREYSRLNFINCPSPNRKTFVATFVAIFIVLIIIYSNSFHNAWHFDDHANIVNNHHIHIKSFSWDEIKNSFFGLKQERLSRPLAYFSFAVNHYLGGTNVFGYHVVNFIIHYLAAVFLFLFIFNMLKTPVLREKYEHIAYPVALLATLFWSMNPIQVSSVTYIVQRMSSMAGLFYVMSMFFYLKGRTTRYSPQSIYFYVLSGLAGLAAVLSKENAVMLPMSILLFDLFFIQGITKENIRKLIKFIIFPLMVILLAGLIYTGGFSKLVSGYEIRDFTLIQRLLTEPRVIIFYISLLFFPVTSRLTLLYDVDISRSLIEPWTTMPAIILILLAVGFSIVIAKRHALISFCIIFFFLNHLIEASFLNLELIYEHRNYIPSMLIFLPAALFAVTAIDRRKRFTQIIAILVVASLLIGLGGLTYRRNSIFFDAFTLWPDNIKKYPLLSRPHFELGTAYLNSKDQQRNKGLREYLRAMELNNFGNKIIRGKLNLNLGLYYYEEGNYSESWKYLETAYKFSHFNLAVPLNMARIKLQESSFREARYIIEKELKKYPESKQLTKMLTFILFKEGQYDKTSALAYTALKNAISDGFYLAILAEMARHEGDLQAAIRLWETSQRFFPKDPYPNLALIELYFQAGHEEAIKLQIEKLHHFKGGQPLSSYIETLSRNKNLLTYIPDLNKIGKIVHKKAMTD